LRYLVTLAFCWLALSVGAACSESDEPATIRISTIVVPPMVVQNPQTGELSGTAVEALHELSDRCAVRLELIVTPSWNRAYMMAQIGIVDGVIPTNFAEDRLAFFDFPPSPLVDMSPTLIVRSDSPIQAFEGLAMLRGKRVAVRTNALLEERFDTFMRSGAAILVERSDSQSLVDELLSGRVDFIADAPAMIIYHMSARKIPERIRFLKPPLGHSGQFLALSRKRAGHLRDGTAASACFLGHESNAP